MVKRNTFLTDLVEKLKGHHNSNKSRGLYGYMWWSGLKIILVWFAIMIPLILTFKYLIDFSIFLIIFRMDLFLQHFSSLNLFWG
jgi:hypothetical protein